MNTQLLIPTKIKVGYQKRNDTYTQKLGYVIYYDQRGVLRKETSWEGWRDKKIDPSDFDNVPTSGFVLNKKAGGTKGHSWEQRSTYCRIYDPRGFEFEISIPNLLFILQECDCSKGKGLEGDFVYGWEGKELVLLPVSSDEYKKSEEYTNLQTQKVSAKTLIPGAIYMNSRMESYIYLGRYNYNERQTYRDGLTSELSEKKMFIFVSVKKPDWGSKYNVLPSLSTIKKVVNETPVDNFSTLLQEFLDSPFSSEFDHYDYFPLTNKEINEIKDTSYYWRSHQVYRKDSKELVKIGLSDYSSKKSYGNYGIIPENINNLPFIQFNTQEITSQYDGIIRKGFFDDLITYVENRLRNTFSANASYFDENELKSNYMKKYCVYKNGSKLKTEK